MRSRKFCRSRNISALSETCANSQLIIILVGIAKKVVEVKVVARPNVLFCLRDNHRHMASWPSTLDIISLYLVEGFQ